MVCAKPIRVSQGGAKVEQVKVKGGARKIDGASMKHQYLGGSGGMLPRKFLIFRCCEMSSEAYFASHS